MNILNRMITTMLNKKSDNFQLKTFIDDAQLISQSRSQWLNDKPMMTDDKYDLLKSKIIDQKEAVMLLITKAHKAFYRHRPILSDAQYKTLKSSLKSIYFWEHGYWKESLANIESNMQAFCLAVTQYEQGEPLISDEEYDQLKNTLHGHLDDLDLHLSNVNKLYEDMRGIPIFSDEAYDQSKDIYMRLIDLLNPDKERILVTKLNKLRYSLRQWDNGEPVLSDEEFDQMKSMIIGKKNEIKTAILDAHDAHYNHNSICSDEDYSSLKYGLKCIYIWEHGYANLDQMKEGASTFSQARSSYYNGNPMMPDEQYDALKNDLKEYVNDLTERFNRVNEQYHMMNKIPVISNVRYDKAKSIYYEMIDLLNPNEEHYLMMQVERLHQARASFVENNPIMSDEQYDTLKADIIAMEPLIVNKIILAHESHYNNEQIVSDEHYDHLKEALQCIYVWQYDWVDLAHIKQQLETLVEARKAYHKGNTMISNEEYDTHKKELHESLSDLHERIDRVNRRYGEMNGIPIFPDARYDEATSVRNEIIHSLNPNEDDALMMQVELLHRARASFSENNPVISDEHYDRLKADIIEMEPHIVDKIVLAHTAHHNNEQIVSNEHYDHLKEALQCIYVWQYDWVDLEHIKQQLETLVEARKAYHEGNTLISNEEYDTHKKELYESLSDLHERIDRVNRRYGEMNGIPIFPDARYDEVTSVRNEIIDSLNPDEDDSKISNGKTDCSCDECDCGSDHVD